MRDLISIVENTTSEYSEPVLNPDPKKMTIRELNKFITDRLKDFHKEMEPWTDELQRKKQKAEINRYRKTGKSGWEGYQEPGRSNDERFGPRGPQG